jgi:hypothetical protein
LITASTAPLRLRLAVEIDAAMRVVALKGIAVAPAVQGLGRMPWLRASSTIERPSGVSSASEARSAASAISFGARPGPG